MFEGFSTAASDFLWGIRFNNDRSWFMEHKSEYTNFVYQPLKALAQEVFQQFQQDNPDLDLELHISRIYRDARRIHNKGPYKDHLWFSFRKPHTNMSTEQPVFWFELRPEGYACGVGLWLAKPFTMECYRKEIDAHPEKLLPLAKKLSKQKEFYLDAQEYKRPKGNPQPPLDAWYNRKGFSICATYDWGQVVESRQLVENLEEAYRYLRPFYTYFDEICTISHIKQMQM